MSYNPPKPRLTSKPVVKANKCFKDKLHMDNRRDPLTGLTYKEIRARAISSRIF